MAIKNWIFAKQNNPQAKQIAEKYDIPLFLADILINRGFDDLNKINHYLHPTVSSLNDPFLMPDMHKAVDRIKLAISNNESITIYGDYDVDGITSVSLLYLYLTSKGVTVHYYIPDRIDEGYGINCKAIDKIAANGSKLIISVDTGITACDEVEYAKTLGIDFVITDHHECAGKIPLAVAVCNPKRPDGNYPFRSLAGVGVVFKLICALHYPAPQEEIIQQYSDLVALGTISDVMPVVDENRYIIQRGLITMSQNRRGLYTLMLASGIRNPDQVSVFDVSFLIAPRINAAGRIGDSLKAVELLISNDPQIWSDVADYLCQLNNHRQTIEANIFAEADAIIQSKKLYKERTALILWKEGWHHGVIGIVASRLKDKYGLPTILFSVSENKAKGSGRSMEPLNLYVALSNLDNGDFQFGGHAMAAGITMDSSLLPAFKQSFCAYTKEHMENQPYTNSIIIDAQLFEEDFSLQNFQKISLLEPYGTNNEVPIFCVKNAIIRDIKPIGNQRHLRLVFQVGTKWINAVYFGMKPDSFSLEAQTSVDVIFQASINEFRGNSDIQMIVKGIRPYEKKYLQLQSDVAKATSGEIDSFYYPNRKIIANIYRFCQKCIENGNTLLEIIQLPVLIKKSGLGYYNLQSIVPSFEILEQIGVLEYIITDNQIMILSIDGTQKVSLEQSALYREMHG